MRLDSRIDRRAWPGAGLSSWTWMDSVPRRVVQAWKDFGQGLECLSLAHKAWPGALLYIDCNYSIELYICMEYRQSDLYYHKQKDVIGP